MVSIHFGVTVMFELNFERHGNVSSTLEKLPHFSAGINMCRSCVVIVTYGPQSGQDDI